MALLWGNLPPKIILSVGEICPPRSMVFMVLFQSAIQSDAQLLSIIARRSNVFIYDFFAHGPPKPSRNHPETARVQNRYFSKGFQLKIDGFSIPGRSRPGPALKVDTFYKEFKRKSVIFRSPAAPDPARISKSMLF